MRVVGESPLVDTTKSTLSGRISQTQVEELPVNGRNWLNFAALAPGVKGDVGQNPQAGVGRGQIGSKVFVDGASTQTASTVGVQTEVSKDVIGEFEVLTNRFDAQLGHAGSVIINAVTKSGTDTFSGSAFYYFRDRRAERQGLLHRDQGAVPEPAVRRHRGRANQARHDALLHQL